MTTTDTTVARNDHDSSLLEGLYQLTISGHTEGWEFEQINSEVYTRLLDAYEAA